jgi:threonine dehydrogenase-like Zn-dependent dehydrogenase
VDERLEVASMFGADDFVDLREFASPEARVARVRELTDRWGADVVMELAGFPAITEEGVRMLAPGGRYVEIGNISPGLTYAADPSYWVTQNITLYGINHYSRRHLRDALDILRRTQRTYPFERIVSHKFPLEQINEAMAEQATGRVTRSSLVP